MDTMKRKPKSGAPYMAEEIIENILKRLPVKSLIRFQCVCKSWKALIQTSSFIAQHHQTSLPLLLLQHDIKPPLQFTLLDSELRDMQIPKVPPFVPTSFVALLIASCNGLLCLRISSSRMSDLPFIVLWNPAIRKSVRVPRITRVRSFPRASEPVIRFGFSPVTNDYNIVLPYMDHNCNISGVEVFSLSRRSWKEIEFGKSLENVSIFHSPTVSANGAIFWTGRRRKKEGGGEEDEKVIISFDLAREVFTLITMPKASIKLCVYEDKLAGLCHNQAAPSKNCPWFNYLWVLEEKGIMGKSMKTCSWVKKCTCGPCPSNIHLGVIWNNAIAGVGYRRSELVSEMKFKVQNPNTKCILFLFSITTNDELKMVPIDRRGASVFNYVESLVPLP